MWYHEWCLRIIKNNKFRKQIWRDPKYCVSMIANLKTPKNNILENIDKNTRPLSHKFLAALKICITDYALTLFRELGISNSQSTNTYECCDNINHETLWKPFLNVLEFVFSEDIKHLHQFVGYLSYIRIQSTLGLLLQLQNFLYFLFIIWIYCFHFYIVLENIYNKLYSYF